MPGLFFHFSGICFLLKSRKLNSGSNRFLFLGAAVLDCYSPQVLARTPGALLPLGTALLYCI